MDNQNADCPGINQAIYFHAELSHVVRVVLFLTRMKILHRVYDDERVNRSAEFKQLGVRDFRGALE